MVAWNEQEALDFVRNLAYLYFDRRDMATLAGYMEERTSWIGTGEGELSRSLAEAVSTLERDAAEYGGSFTVTDEQLAFVPLSGSSAVVYGTLRATPEDVTLSEENLRLSVVLERTGEGLRLVHMHFSHPDAAQEWGRYFVSQTARADNQTLRLALGASERQLANLTKNIPGGAHQCANDPDLTLLSMSDGFLSMFGYTREDIDRLFEGKFINMVVPGDRPGMLQSTCEQLGKGPDLELEYRVMCKDGEPVWVLDKGRLIDDGNGGQCFYCLLIEITDRKRQQEELRLTLERHQVIMDQATDIIFEWDIRLDTLHFSSNWSKKFGYHAIDSRISDRIPLSQNIHPDDMPAFVKIMKDTAAGVPYSETEFRIRDVSGRYCWCRIRATAQYDSDRRPIKAVGVIVDIDAEKKQKQMLIDQAQRDALTGLYNKAAVGALVEARMKDQNPAARQALFIIDVDHFKAVNDTYGHLCGDFVLSNVAEALKSGTRSTDLVGRIGGDEFLVYLPEVADEAAALQKAERILASVAGIAPEKGAAPITCSIGAAVFPCGSVSFNDICKCADQALYRQKDHGRGGVSLFGEAHDPCCPTADGVVVSEDDDAVDEGLSQYAFRTLYEAVDVEWTVNRLLEILGRSFDVSRVYIFESSEDGHRCSNTFEWCGKGVAPQIDQLQNIAYVDELGDYLRNFDANGMFYCHDIQSLHPDVFALLAPQGIRSMLQCAMLDEGKFVGYVGFDECRENRVWSRQQVSAFKLTADVLSTFLVKHRQKQKLK